MSKYAGIGSRKTPKEILGLFDYLGRYFAKRRFLLRSGAADGADTAFEDGCDIYSGPKEIYLPWKGFNGNGSELILPDPIPETVEKISIHYHPNWFALKPEAKKLIARDAYQILGQNLNDPVDFIICYTAGGRVDGGTGQAIRIAMDHNIPVVNAGAYPDLEKFKEKVNEIVKGTLYYPL